MISVCPPRAAQGRHARPSSPQHKGRETWHPSWSEQVAKAPTPENERRSIDRYVWDLEVDALARTREYGIDARHSRPPAPGEVRVIRDGMVTYARPEAVYSESVRRLALALGDYRPKTVYAESTAGSAHQLLDLRLRELNPPPRDFTQLALVVCRAMGGDQIVARFDAEGFVDEAQFRFEDGSVIWFDRRGVK